jgi:hypothetical protein
MLLVLADVLIGNVCYCSYTWTVQLIKGVFHLDFTSLLWFEVVRVLVYAFWGLGG